MKRSHAEQVAERLVAAQVGTADRPEMAAGIRLAAMMIAETVCQEGTIEERVFLERCGIALKTFRRDGGLTCEERYDEILAQRSMDDP